VRHPVRISREDWVSLQSEGRETHGGSRKPWDSEPAQTSHDITRKSINWASSDGLVVITVVAEHSSEISDNVDDEEDSTLLGSHGEVAALSVAGDWMSLSGLNQQIEDLSWTAQDVARRVGCEGKCEKNDENDDSVGIVSQESSLDTTKHGVEHDTNREEETSSGSWNTGELRENQHGSWP